MASDSGSGIRIWGRWGEGSLTGIYANAGDHIEDSGSAPLKKARAGEVAIGFGLRHQAVADKASGLPIDLWTGGRKFFPYGIGSRSGQGNTEQPQSYGNGRMYY